MSPRLQYMLANWKTGVHLVLRTYHFGVDNRWWVCGRSRWGRPWWWKLRAILMIKPLILSYHGMKRRAGTMGHFMADAEFELAFGQTKNEAQQENHKWA